MADSPRKDPKPITEQTRSGYDTSGSGSKGSSGTTATTSRSGYETFESRSKGPSGTTAIQGRSGYEGAFGVGLTLLVIVSQYLVTLSLAIGH